MFPDVSHDECYVRWQHGPVSAGRETSQHRALSREWTLEEWRCEAGLRVWHVTLRDAWQCPTPPSGGPGPTSWCPGTWTPRTLSTSRRRAKWGTLGSGNASWFLWWCSLWSAEVWDAPATFFINTAARRVCWSGRWKNQVKIEPCFLLRIFIVAVIVFCPHPIMNRTSSSLRFCFSFLSRCWLRSPITWSWAPGFLLAMCAAWSAYAGSGRKKTLNLFTRSI